MCDKVPIVDASSTDAPDNADEDDTDEDDTDEDADVERTLILLKILKATQNTYVDTYVYTLLDFSIICVLSTKD